MLLPSELDGTSWTPGMGVGSGVAVMDGVGVGGRVGGRGVEVGAAGGSVGAGEALCPPHAYRLVEKITRRMTADRFARLMMFSFHDCQADGITTTV